MLALLLSGSLSHAATGDSCSFMTMVTADEYSYNVTSQPSGSCEKQTLTVSVLKQTLPFTRFASFSDSVVEKAWAEDLDADGSYELLILSHNFHEPAKKSLEIFAVEGGSLKQIRLPASGPAQGYRGGDRFFTESGRLVRAYPRYLPGDTDGKPSGGLVRTLFQYRNRELLTVGGKENIRNDAAPSVIARGKLKGEQPVRLKSIQVKQDFVEIKADGTIENYKTTRIADPWRLVIDIPGAASDLQVKEVVIDSFGISRVRIGADKDRVRLVFDSAVSPLPTETITQAENALRVGFYKPRKK